MNFFKQLLYEYIFKDQTFHMSMMINPWDFQATQNTYGNKSVFLNGVQMNNDLHTDAYYRGVKYEPIVPIAIKDMTYNKTLIVWNE